MENKSITEQITLNNSENVLMDFESNRGSDKEPLMLSELITHCSSEGGFSL